MIRTNIDLAFASLRASKTRSFLTMVAVIIGIASFTVVTTTVNGLRDSTENQVDNLGGNLITINPGNLISEDENGTQTINPAAIFGASTLTEEDLEDVSKNVSGIESIAPQILISGQTSHNERILQSGLIIATNQQYPAAFGQELDSGTFLSEGGDTGNFAVVGSNVVNELFGGELALGTKIKLRGEDFTVLGSMKEYRSGLSFSGVDINNAVFISLSSAEKLTNTQPLIQEIDIQLEDGVDAEEKVQEIEEILLQNHGGEKDFTVLTQNELIKLTDSLFGVVRTFGQVLSLIMLGVASIVILLIMLISVRERTREIGIRKSLGATNLNILTQFLTESLVLSWIGSLFGIATALVLGIAVKNYTDITPAYDSATFISVFVLSTLVGALAGAIPAWLAARKNPVESLRNE